MSLRISLPSRFRGHPTVYRTRQYSNHASPAIVNIPRANVYRFGNSTASNQIFSDFQWTVNDGENWAIVGSGSGEKSYMFQMLLGRLRVIPPPPPPGGMLPFLVVPPGPLRDPHDAVSLVSFAQRPRSFGSAFYDYTARYGAVWEDDRITLRQSMFPELISENFHGELSSVGDNVQVDQAKKKLFEGLVDKLALRPFLDLPIVALSNGQTRRARIVKALLSKPDLLLLDEPFSGIDVNSRPILASLLHSLHTSKNPRVILGLRLQDPVPEWISHIALVNQGRVTTGRKEAVFTVKQTSGGAQGVSEDSVTKPGPDVSGKVLVDLKNVKVIYGERQVLTGIHWTIRAGDRWHLQGANGSGKTTLLSLLTGDHPQSYAQLPPTSHLSLFGHPRTRIPTLQLRSLIGVVSPELYNAFPRRAGMTVWQAIGTGFDGGFVPYGEQGVGVGLSGKLTKEEIRWRVDRVWEVLTRLGPGTWSNSHNSQDPGARRAAETFGSRSFIDLSAGEQSMVLLMRALVGRPQLVLLDEAWCGMDDLMVRAARTYLREGGIGSDQAVVVISHWEEEVPWTKGDGVRRFFLVGGQGSEV